MANLFRFIGFMSLILGGSAETARVTSPGIGDYAAQVLHPVGILNNFIGSAAIIIGAACLFAAFYRYNQYRINPLASPISTVFFLLILGLILLILPFMYMFVGGVPFSLTHIRSV